MKKLTKRSLAESLLMAGRTVKETAISLETSEAYVRQVEEGLKKKEPYYQPGHLE